ncbi:MAG: alpha-galactosidase [Clostridia bacterium]|nr:alpha-galactosidase [Clostridia bacterium]
MDIRFERNGIYVDIEICENGFVALHNCSSVERPRGEITKWYPLVELQGSGYNHNDHHASKHTLCAPGSDLRYVGHSLARNEQGDLFEMVQATDEIEVKTFWQFYDGVKALRVWNEVTNISASRFPLEYISSFALTGIGHDEGGSRGDYSMAIPHNTWYGECQWKTNTLHELGYDPVNSFSMKRIALSSTGTWACSEHLPMGAFLQADGAMLWQIETSGSWCWEVSDLKNQLYLRLSGPSWQEHQFLKRLNPGETFVSVPCALTFGRDFEQSVCEMTAYRRRIRRPNADNEHPSVIFNDYMNCLWGDPTTEKEFPLIDAAAEAGCRYYCIDCGWYDDGPWWDGVGRWLPAKGRFPGGIKEVLDYIRQKGMIPGLWLEIEVMGIECSMAKEVPDDWFFQIEGRRVIDHSRYQLDFRNPAVVAHANEVVDRLVQEYGVGYIKMDYNINAGVGTQLNTDTAGTGLLEHTRAYLKWIDDVFARYPDLVIENCSSGGMRMEYSHLSRHSIQSVTDQDDYVKMAAIACNCMTAVTPEQAAIWSYPKRDGDEEETIFNMVSAMLLRIHQSGHLAELSKERLALVSEGIATHMEIVDKLKTGMPFWPIGLGAFGDPFLCVGVRCENEAYMALWHTCEGEETIRIPMRSYQEAELIYPKAFAVPMSYADGALEVTLSGVSARLFRLW